MIPLTSKDREVAIAQGFVEEWIKTAPEQVKAAFNTVSNGVEYYREMAHEIDDRLTKLQIMYNNLSVQAALYLQDIGLLRDQQESVQREEQKQFHQPKEETGSQS